MQSCRAINRIELMHDFRPFVFSRWVGYLKFNMIAYADQLIKSEERNNLLVKLIITINSNYHGRCLVVSDRLHHVDILARRIEELHVPVTRVTLQTKRTVDLKAMQRIIIGTKAVYEFVPSIRRVPNIVYATPKSFKKRFLLFESKNIGRQVCVDVANLTDCVARM